MDGHQVVALETQHLAVLLNNNTIPPSLHWQFNTSKDAGPTRQRGGEEVDFIGYVNEQGLLEEMVTLAKGEGEGNSMEEEVLVGSALAFDDKVLSWGTSFRREQARARGQNGAPC